MIAPEDDNEEQSFSKLENHVEEGKEEKWSNDFRGKGHIEDGRTELNVLESCFHADGASTPVQMGRDGQQETNGSTCACLSPFQILRPHCSLTGRWKEART